MLGCVELNDELFVVLLLLILVFDVLLVAAAPEREPLVEAEPVAPNVSLEPVELVVELGVWYAELELELYELLLLILVFVELVCADEAVVESAETVTGAVAVVVPVVPYSVVVVRVAWLQPARARPARQSAKSDFLFIGIDELPPD